LPVLINNVTAESLTHFRPVVDECFVLNGSPLEIALILKAIDEWFSEFRRASFAPRQQEKWWRRTKLKAHEKLQLRGTPGALVASAEEVGSGGGGDWALEPGASLEL
jgi:hypothetical protein